MFLDYSKLEFDKDGIPEPPELVLQTLNEETIGVIPGVSNLKMNIKFSEPSTIKFDVAAKVNGADNWIYPCLTGYKVLYTKRYGIYLLSGPKNESDGIEDVKHIEGFSIEKWLDTKRFFLEGGTFKFYDPLNKNNPDTIIGRILEKATGWDVGYISLTLAQRYRTFEQYDDYLLSFIYGDATQNFRAVFVFDPYARTINAYDADEERENLPIYLDFDNLLESIEIEENSKELVTALRPYGADGLDIRDVNPIGSEWLYDLSFFISNGDIPSDLAAKWELWQKAILNRQAYYRGLVSLQASSTARLISAQASLTDLSNRLENLRAEQSVVIQAVAMEPSDGLSIEESQSLGATINSDTWEEKMSEGMTSAVYNGGTYIFQYGSSWRLNGKAVSLNDYGITVQDAPSYGDTITVKCYGKSAQRVNLKILYRLIAEKEAEKSDAEDGITEIQEELDESNPSSYAYQVKEIVNELAIKKYFTTEEYETISKYLIEQDIVEDTFVGTSLDTTVTSDYGTFYDLTNGTVVINGSAISEVDLRAKYGKRIYTLAGGTFKLTSHRISCDIIRGTLETTTGNTFVMTMYAGQITSGSNTATSGMITISGTYENLTGDIRAVTVDGVTTLEGTALQMNVSDSSMYLTANISDYQKYSVEMELFDYGATILKELATPTYEFNVDSGNFVFSHDFAPFRNKLQLGKGVYLNVGEKRVITPYIIEFELDFEDISKFSVLFSNRFKRYDNVNTLKDMIEKSYSTSRSFDAAKHISSQVAGQASLVAAFMKESFDSAANTIQAASNQSVIIDGAGIHVSSGDTDDPVLQKFKLRIVNGMIAMTKDDWQTADLAIGVFKTSNGYHTGVNAQVIAGRLIVGTELVIDTGAGHFKVDESGVYVDGTKFMIRHDTGNTSLEDEIAASGSNAFAAAQTALFNAITASTDFDIDPNVAVYYSDTMPEGTEEQPIEENDIWYLTGDGVVVDEETYDAGTIFQYDGDKWVWNTSTEIRTALDNAREAQKTAYGKVMFYRQNYITEGVPPTDDHSTGDLWFNTAAKDADVKEVDVGKFDRDQCFHGKLYRYNGTVWEVVEDSSIAENKQALDNTIAEFYSNGYLSASKLNGVIDAQNSQMNAASGNVLFDGEGLWLLNESTKESATQAVWMNELGVLFGSGNATGSDKKSPGDKDSGWKWTTAISHDGITANALAGKTISGLTMFGGKLLVGKKKVNPTEAIEDWNFAVDENGVVTARSGTFTGTVKAEGFMLKDASGNYVSALNANKLKGDFIESLTANKITAGVIDANVVTINNLVVGDNVTMGPNATITWNNVSSKPTFSSVATSGSYSDLSDKPTIPSDGYITTITENTITTTNVTALNLHVKAANIEDIITVPKISYGNYTLSLDPNDAPIRAGNYGFSFVNSTTTEDVFSLFDWNSGDNHTATMTVKNWGVFTFKPDSWDATKLGNWGTLQIWGDVDVKGSATGLYLRFTA